MFKFQLNLRKPNNYAFFCPVSKMHLTVSNPLGFAEGVTPAILRGLHTKVLLDVDGVVDMTTGKLKVAKQGEETSVKPVTPVTTEFQKDSEVTDDTQPSADAAVNSGKKRGKKSASSEVTTKNEIE